jgi:hypothetical protein
MCMYTYIQKIKIKSEDESMNENLPSKVLSKSSPATSKANQNVLSDYLAITSARGHLIVVCIDCEIHLNFWCRL